MRRWLSSSLIVLSLTWPSALSHALGDALSPTHTARISPRHTRSVRWQLQRSGAWTLGLHYSTQRARKGHDELAVRYPNLQLPPQWSALTLDRDEQDDAPSQPMMVAAEDVARALGTLHWLQRFGPLELLAGVIMPGAERRPEDDGTKLRVTLQFLPAADRNPDMIHARLTLFSE